MGGVRFGREERRWRVRRMGFLRRKRGRFLRRRGFFEEKQGECFEEGGSSKKEGGFFEEGGWFFKEEGFFEDREVTSVFFEELLSPSSKNPLSPFFTTDVRITNF